MKRFYKAATAAPTETGFTVALDGRAIRTPATTPFIVPTLALAQAIAAEWEAQEGGLDHSVMRLTTLAYAALDRTRISRPMVIEETAAYAGSDLLCYRADDPQELLEEQTKAWQPLLDWAASDLQIDLTVARGIVRVTQSDAALQTAKDLVAACDNFALAAVDRMTHITGSLIIALAVLRGRLQAEEAYEISHMEDRWQTKLWGTDEEAEERHNIRIAEMVAAQKFVIALG